MNEETKDLVRYRLMRAEETLEDARILVNNNKLFSAVNRIYYAMFYAVGGLLLTKGLSASKHSGLLSLFNREFVNSGLIDKEWGRFYNEMFEFRQKADYKDLVKFVAEDVRLWLSKAEGFILAIRTLIQKSLDNTGLTLLEILVSTLILALVMTGLANIFVAGKRHILRSRSRMTGGELGKYFLEPLQMDVRQDQWGSNCLSNGTNCPDSQEINGITYTPNYTRTSNFPITNINKVKVDITWPRQE